MTENNTESNNSNSNKENNKPPEYIRVHLIICGKVQGVYFRKHAQDISLQNNVSGWVRNLSNGNVECVLEGLKSNVEQVVRWCHQGPPNSQVDNVEIEYEQFKGNFIDFKIL